MNENKSSKKTRIFLIILLFLVVIGESLYYGFAYMQKKEKIDFFQNKIREVSIDIKTLKNMRTNNSISSEFIQKTEEEFGNKKYIFGANTGGVKFKEKISRAGKKNAFYTIDLQFSVDSYESLRILLSILYLNKNVMKITDINLQNHTITLIIKG